MENEPTPPPTPVASTLDSLAEKHYGQELDLGKAGKVHVQPWHVAAIKAKFSIPGNREMDEGRFQQLMEDVVQISIK